MRQKCSEIEFKFGAIVRLAGNERFPSSLITYKDVPTLDVDEELGIAYVGGDRYSLHGGEIRRWRLQSADASKIGAEKKAEGRR